MIRFRYIFFSIVAPFFMVTGIISSILLMDQVYRFIPFLGSIGIRFTPVFQMLAFSFPSIAFSTAPIGMMLAVYIALNRLSLDSEIIAMRASGISLGYLYKPVLSFVFLVAMGVAALSLWVSPMAVSALEELKFNLIKYQSKVNINPREIKRLGDNLIFAFDKKEETLQNIFISNWNKPEKTPVIMAERGKIDFLQEEQKVVFHLYNGSMHILTDEESHQMIRFKQFDYPIEFSSDQRKHLPKRFRDTKKGKTYKTDFEITHSELIELIDASEVGSTDYKEYRTELHSRFIPPLACFTLSLFALPIGIVNPRTGNRSGLLKILVVMIAFYVSYSKVYSMSNDGDISPYFLYSVPISAIFLGIVYFLKANYDFENIKEIYKSLKK